MSAPQTMGELIEQSTAGFKLYTTPNLPTVWIVEDAAGEFWIVPAVWKGWLRKSRWAAGIVPARRKYLEPVPLVCAHGLGLPL